MTARIRQLPRPLLVLLGGLAALAGVAVWQLAIEFERAWIRSYEGPLVGDAIATDRGVESPPAPALAPTGNKRRRWVSEHHPRARRVTHAA
jgi:hypothetical protein